MSALPRKRPTIVSGPHVAKGHVWTRLGDQQFGELVYTQLGQSLDRELPVCYHGAISRIFVRTVDLAYTTPVMSRRLANEKRPCAMK